MWQDMGESVVLVYILLAIGWYTYEWWRDHEK